MDYMTKFKVGDWVTVVVKEYSGYVEKVGSDTVTLSNNLPAAGMQHETVLIESAEVVRIEPNPGMKVKLE
jgi:hypothetical protein